MATASNHNNRPKTTLWGGTGRANVLVGTKGEDIIRGREGEDTIRGKRSTDRLFGEEGADTVGATWAQTAFAAETA